jgi:2-polyprenyl-6-methoxyphenol hydroxylase-like FAD-dependent oxidoreductase
MGGENPHSVQGSEVDVLVVGGGPVGLTMAGELMRHGVRCRVVDKLEAPPIWSKAAGIQARTMEVFELMGLVDELLARGRKMVGVNVFSGTKRVAHLDLDIPGTSYPYILGMEQRQTERLLTAHLERLGGRLERPVELIGFAQSDEGVEATLRHAEGTEERVRAGWLVGCDGARSFVRHELELPFEGSTFEQTLLQGDVRVKVPFELAPDEAFLFVSPHGPIGGLPLLEDGRYRVIAMAPPDDRLAPTLENLQALATERGGAGFEVSDPAWVADFRFHGRLVSRYRVGRVFLAGDAAHIHSPAGAQGMNMGIQDAFNLAWKLALVVRGLARPELLDSYEAERRPVADATVRTTDRGTKAALRFLSLRSTLAQALRNQIVGMVINTGIVPNRAFRRLGGLMVDYTSSPAVGEYHSSVWRANLAGARVGEHPNVRDWYAFNQGPGPGERVADLVLEPSDGGPPTSLYALLTEPRHALLLFDGAEATPEGYDNLNRIADAVEGRFGGAVRVHVVVPSDAVPAVLARRRSVVLDEQRLLHAHFGSSTESLYLVRPDGYVGYRSQPADFEHLMAYLDTVFVPRATMPPPSAVAGTRGTSAPSM